MLRDKVNKHLRWLTGRETKFAEMDSPELPVRGASLSPELPGSIYVNCLPDCFGHSCLEPSRYIFWLPAEPPISETVCLASSRRGRQLETQHAWLDALRTAMTRSILDGGVLLGARGMTVFPFLQVANRCFGASVIECRRIPNQARRKWFVEQAAIRRPPNWFCVYYREAVPAANAPVDIRNTESVDAVIIKTARQVRVLALRANGNVHNAITARSAQEQSASVWLAANDELISPELRRELCQAGAIEWVIDKTSIEPSKSPRIDNAPLVDDFPFPAVEGEFLFHWTRARKPDRKSAAVEYYRSLLFRMPGDPSGATAALLSIIAQQRLVASRGLIRARRPVVCFTANPIREWKSLRVFRSHLSRWDYEPFGIALKKSKLEQLGARQVVYGNDQDWEILSREDRVFFQLAKNRKGSSRIDWTWEREWRVPGDVDLRRFGAEDAFVFAKNAESAALIRPWSRWPVLVCG